MSSKYTNKMLPNDPKLFPEPTTWMSWVREFPRTELVRNAGGEPVRKLDAQGRHIGYEYVTKEPGPDGKIRHHYTRAETRKALMWLGSMSKYREESERGRFTSDWAVYEFVEGEWVLRGSGKKGEYRKHNEFFATKIPKGERKHPFDKVQEDLAIQSILQAAG